MLEFQKNLWLGELAKEFSKKLQSWRVFHQKVPNFFYHVQMRQYFVSNACSSGTEFF